MNTLLSSFTTAGTFSLAEFIICLLVALAIGIAIAIVYKAVNHSSQSLAISLALLPAVVAVVIMVVNGNVGTGVAVAGAFSLVRFRSQPGSAKEIAVIFLAMGAGLMCGMGYLSFALVYTLVLVLALFILVKIGFGTEKPSAERQLRITIPENLNYMDVFDEIFDYFTTACQLESVKTTNMGSMYRLTYSVVLKDPKEQKLFIDSLRIRNGNLEISLNQKEANHNDF